MTETGVVDIMVDVFWPHPLASDSPLIEHKCHKRELKTFPSIWFLISNNQKLAEYISDFYKDPYTGKSLVQKVSCLYGESLFPEKLIVLLKQPLKITPPEELMEQLESKDESVVE